MTDVEYHLSCGTMNIGECQAESGWRDGDLELWSGLKSQVSMA